MTSTPTTTSIKAVSSSSSSSSSSSGSPEAPSSSSSSSSVSTWRNWQDFDNGDTHTSTDTGTGKGATAAGNNKKNKKTHTHTKPKTALIILNTDCTRGPLFHKFWSLASLRICADGGANRLYDGLGGTHIHTQTQTKQEEEDKDKEKVRSLFIPHAIKGDLDSLRPDVAAYYKTMGTKVIKDEDQDTNDLEKCLELVRNGEVEGDSVYASESEEEEEESDDDKNNKAGAASPTTPPQATATNPKDINVIVLGALGQRFDHAMANCHLLYRYQHTFHRLLLVGNESVAFLLSPGKHIIEPDTKWEGPVCGLIPLAQPCRKITTEGLRWNLKGEEMKFGGLVSTSNEFVLPPSLENGGGVGEEGEGKGLVSVCVEVETSDPIIWTTSVKEGWQQRTLET